MKQTFALVAVLAAFASPVSAEYTVKGSVECPDIIKEDGNENYREFNKWWLLGYFTGRNFAASAEVGKGIEADQIYSMALNYCEANAASDWDDAAIHIYDLLK